MLETRHRPKKPPLTTHITPTTTLLPIHTAGVTRTRDRTNRLLRAARVVRMQRSPRMPRANRPAGWRTSPPLLMAGRGLRRQQATLLRHCQSVRRSTQFDTTIVQAQPTFCCRCCSGSSSSASSTPSGNGAASCCTSSRQRVSTCGAPHAQRLFAIDRLEPATPPGDARRATD